jgi:hypothetical protein
VHKIATKLKYTKIIIVNIEAKAVGSYVDKIAAKPKT